MTAHRKALRSVLAAAPVLCVPLLCAPGVAFAAPFTSSDLSAAQSILSGFNAVAGTYSKGNETEGRIVSGGDLVGTGNGNVCFNGCAGTASVNGTVFGAATIYGSVSGAATFDVMNGNAAVAGNLSSGSEFNHAGGLYLGGSNTGTISDATFVTTGASSAGRTQNTRVITTGAANAFGYGSYASLFATPLNDLVSTIAAIVPTLGNVQAIPDHSSNYSSTATAATGGRWSGGYSYGFYTATAAALADAANFNSIGVGSLSAVFVLVTDGGSVTLPTVQNGSGNNHIVWVLPNATAVSLNGQFKGTVLAPGATFSNKNGDMDGLVYASAISQTNEFHATSEFTGTLAGLAPYETTAAATPVPAPGSLPLLAGALPLLVALRRHRTA